jgi:predicted nucleic acid-binding protein
VAANQIILDSGALSSLAEKKGPVRFAIEKAVSEGAIVIVPTVVLAESTTGSGPRDARVNRAMRACEFENLDEGLARSAAALRFRRPECGVVDAVVVATADAYPGSTILTSDPRDIRALAMLRGSTGVVVI